MARIKTRGILDDVARGIRARISAARLPAWDRLSGSRVGRPTADEPSEGPAGSLDFDFAVESIRADRDGGDPSPGAIREPVRK